MTPEQKPDELNLDSQDAQEAASDASAASEPTYAPLSEEQKSRLLAHFKEIQDYQRAHGIDNSGPRNRE